MELHDLRASVRQARGSAGLTQAELARRIGTTQSAVSRLEAGRLLPTLALLERVAIATGRPITLVLGAPEWPRPEGADRSPSAAAGPPARGTAPLPDRPAAGRPLPSASRRRIG